MPSAISNEAPRLAVNLVNKFKTREPKGIYKYHAMKFTLGRTAEEARNVVQAHNNIIFAGVTELALKNNPSVGTIPFTLNKEGSNLISNEFTGKYLAFHLKVVAFGNDSESEKE